MMDLPLTLIIRVAWAEGSTILWLDAVTGAGHAHRILIRLGPTDVPAHDNSMSNAVHAKYCNRGVTPLAGGDPGNIRVICIF